MLTIAKVSRKDAGLYECAAANILGTAISSCTLAVARKEAGGTSGDRKGTSWAHGWGPASAGHLSTALHICKRSGLLKDDRLVLHEYFPASLNPCVVMHSDCSSSALPLAGHPAHPVCTLAGLPGRPGTPEIPQKYKNTVLVLWKPAESKAPCTYTLECRLDGMWCCLPSPGSHSQEYGLTEGTKARTKVPNVLAVPCDLAESRAGDSGLPLSLVCPCLTLLLLWQGSMNGRLSAPVSLTATST